MHIHFGKRYELIGEISFLLGNNKAERLSTCELHAFLKA